MKPAYYIQMALAQKTHWWFSARRVIIGELIQTLKLVKYNCKILEIGCGTGANLKLLEKYGDVSAVEMDCYAIEYAKTFFSGDLRQGKLPDQIPFSDEKFDLICLFDVLEHIEDDIAALQKTCDLLESDGKIIITVPAYQWLYGEHDCINHHYRRYSANLLHRVISCSGLKVCRMGYFNTLLFPAALAKRVLSKMQIKNNTTDEIKVPFYLLNSFFYYLFSAEKFFLKYIGFPYGLSVFAIIEKRDNL